MARVAVFGMGYVGCVTAACLCKGGHSVVGVDVDIEKIKLLKSGQPTVLEKDLPELIREMTDNGLLTATNDVESAIRNTDVALIAVGTPSRDDGGVSSSSVEGVIASIGKVLSQIDKPYVVCVRSTLMPGIVEQRLQPLLNSAAGRPIAICNNPEFLREGSAIADYFAPPYVIVGADDDETAEAIFQLYNNVDVEKIATDIRTAAMVKYACNAFHALKVAFANEIGSLCKDVGADGHAVMSFVRRDTKLNVSPAYLKPGLPFGGSCLPKDVRAMVRVASEQATDLQLLPSILRANEKHLARTVQLIQAAGLRRVGVVGLSFKAGTDDLRESPLVAICETLIGKGYDVRIYDPNIAISRLRGRNLAFVDQHLPHLANLLVEDLDVLLDHSDLLVVGSDVARDVDLANSRAAKIIDLRRDLAMPTISEPAVL